MAASTSKAKSHSSEDYERDTAKKKHRRRRSVAYIVSFADDSNSCGVSRSSLTRSPTYNSSLDLLSMLPDDEIPESIDGICRMLFSSYERYAKYRRSIEFDKQTKKDLRFPKGGFQWFGNNFLIRCGFMLEILGLVESSCTLISEKIRSIFADLSNEKENRNGVSVKCKRGFLSSPGEFGLYTPDISVFPTSFNLGKGVTLCSESYEDEVIAVKMIVFGNHGRIEKNSTKLPKCLRRDVKDVRRRNKFLSCAERAQESSSLCKGIESCSFRVLLSRLNNINSSLFRSYYFALASFGELGNIRMHYKRFYEASECHRDKSKSTYLDLESAHSLSVYSEHSIDMKGCLYMKKYDVKKSIESGIYVRRMKNALEDVNRKIYIRHIIMSALEDNYPDKFKADETSSVMREIFHFMAPNVWDVMKVEFK